uniref:Disks large-associated protein 1 isoform X1 n=1 Tax=Geotrypetes seraphini TaxID=260995 RepID=A0A6P8Q230_GEOSA|nr:disks large-associated protein 1 isoform X1 [Geotrypetes seraphini]XP_033790290.1 disks large-associated protein 1 isoform X1 [Geotrypetes seraphini]XP_033790291.1 disks large-associated protein 1 isoform X1 [Geotrypetes seraphini]XP_033790292.1 disks large-associated protein 1 isoform X1 [Geotrypetes seraphini]
MKGLSSIRSHHHGVACDPSCDVLPYHPDRKPYLLNPVDPYPIDHSYYGQRNSFPAECMMPYGDQIASSTFPRRHYNSHQESKEESSLVPHGTVAKANRIPANLLDKFERQLPINRDGYHTLQYKRTAVEQRSDSPGRIRHLVHSVQKLFTKSHSLEGPSKGNVNGNKASPEETQTVRYGKRSKSKDRRSEVKPRSNISGWWGSDDNLDSDACFYHSPTGVMTMGRCPDRSASQYFMEAYNTINEHALKSSRSNNDVKCSTCSNLPISLDSQLMKKGSWSSTLTVSRAREVYQKGSLNMDQTVAKSESSQPERACQYLQVPQDEWSGFTPQNKDDEIPCRRMRSGSYIKAMGDEDSGDSDTASPKPSPKMAARRESYLKATQPSLTELTTLKISNEHSPKLQIRSHSYLRAVSEVSINRSMDTLDPTSLLASPKFRSRNESYMRAMSTLSQMSEMELNGQFESVCESVFSELESQAVEALDLPMPGCFRMRSHSYVRAIEKGCSQDDECVSLRSSSPPRTTTTVRTIQSSTVSSCITTYKKTPPPVPPRTTTKPFISITAQSSTESAQDAYMDGHGQRGDIISQSGFSNSTESLDSMKALTAAIEAANAQIHGPASQHMDDNTTTVNSTSTVASITADDRKRNHFRKNLSIGVQVDGSEEAARAEENKAIYKFQSVGIQVEDERGRRRFTRSNSVTAAVQANLDLQEHFAIPMDVHEGDNWCSDQMLRHGHTRDTGSSTVSIQGSGNHYHACTGDDDFDADFDPSILPPPDPWIDSITEDPMEAVQRSVCHRDGHWFLKLLQAEKDRMEGWCQQMEQEEQEYDLPDHILGKIRSAVGCAQLLMSQKFHQFRELCEENLNPNAHPRPTSQDLAGFWDMLQLSIENISMKFDELHQLKANNWKQMDPLDKKERRAPPPVPKKPSKGQVPLVRDRSLESTDRRHDARKRLMAAKRAASVRQNSATESADSIEIYIPEAQTRL